MYKQFNKELDFKKVKHKNKNKEKEKEDNNDNKNKNHEFKINQKIDDSPLEEKKENPQKISWENKFNFTKKSNDKADYKQATSLNYKFSVNFLKSPERPSSSSENNPKSILENSNNNKILISSKDTFKNNYLHSQSVFNKKHSDNSVQSKEINQTNSNRTGENSENNNNNNFLLKNNNSSNDKKSLKTPRSKNSEKSNNSCVSKDSSKYNYRMFLKKENSIASNNQEKSIEHLRSSNPNILKANLQQEDTLLHRLRGSNKNSFNENEANLNKRLERSTGTLNFLSNKFNYNSLVSPKDAKEDKDKSEFDFSQRVKSDLDNFYNEFLDKVNERRVSRIRKLYINIFLMYIIKV